HERYPADVKCLGFLYLYVGRYPRNNASRNTEKIESMTDEYHSRVIGKIPFDKKVHDALIDKKSIAAVGEGDAYGALLAMWSNLRREIDNLKTGTGRNI
ncbi:MAG: hypothetical protein BECKG1743E_GA0114224_107781, partial [Candidatus Kentron sp. G]